METIQTEKIKKDTLFEYYEEIEREMQDCSIPKQGEYLAKIASENAFYEIFDNNLYQVFEDPANCSPSDDLLRELHTICKAPEIAKKMVEAIEKIAREELANRKEKARLKVIEVYNRIHQPTQTEKVA